MKLWHAYITLIVCTLIAAWNPFLLDSAKLSYFDFLQRNHPESTSAQIVLIDIDEQSIAAEGQWPWSREVLAKYIDKIPDNNLIALNILFSEKDKNEGDGLLALSLAGKPIVLSTQTTNQIQTERKLHVGTTTLGPVDADIYLPNYQGILLPIEELSQSAQGYGSLSSMPSVDGIVRKLPIIVSSNNKVYPSCALEILRVAVGDISYQIKTNEDGVEFVRIPAFNPISTSNDGSVYNSYWNKFKRYSFTELDTIPEGSIIIIGATFEGSNVVATPVGAMYPHDVQANLVKTMIDGTTITRQDSWELFELASLVLGGIILLLFLKATPVLLSGAVFVILIGGAIGISYQTFYEYYLLLNPVAFCLGVLITFSHGAFAQFYTQFKLRQLVKKQFEHYLSPAMVKELRNDPSLLKLGGETRTMSYLFSDIRGFTPISEQFKTNPQGLSELINRYMTPMTDIVMDNKGTVDKYIGDALMAIWNAPIDIDNHPDLAIKSALDMEIGLEKLNKELTEAGLLNLAIGVGVNTGDAVAGNMGSDKRFDYTVLGDSVNLAARLEGQTKDYGLFLLFTEHTLKLLKDDYNYVTMIDKISVKGQTVPVTIYTILEDSEYSDVINNIVSSYQSRKWDVCDFNLKYLRLNGWNDTIADMYEKRINNPLPAEDWDGVERKTTK
jgi:adenylate cyclase